MHDCGSHQQTPVLEQRDQLLELRRQRRNPSLYRQHLSGVPPRSTQLLLLGEGELAQHRVRRRVARSESRLQGNLARHPPVHTAGQIAPCTEVRTEPEPRDRGALLGRGGANERATPLAGAAPLLPARRPRARARQSAEEPHVHRGHPLRAGPGDGAR